MILTLTVNPAVDQTLWVDRLEVGRVNRPRETQLDPAGKGINVSRMVKRLGWPTVAFGFLAGEIGQLVRRALAEEHVQHHFVDVRGQTRINVTVNDRSSGAATSFYDPGPAVDREAIMALDELLEFWLRSCRVLVLGGSLLPGIAAGYYADLVRRANALDVRVIVDTDGKEEQLAIEARPFLIKPNITEAERLLGRPLKDLAAITDGARELVGRGIQIVVISMGGGGAVCAERGGVWHVEPPAVERLSTVGSGDSLVAGLAIALARGDGLEAGLRLGTAAGAATAMSPGTALGTAAEVARLAPLVRLRRLAAQ